MQRDFAGVIALCEKPHELAVRHDEQGADVFVGHELDGLKDRGVGRDGPQSRAFVMQ